ncbi:MAG: hypothetical protein ACE5JN_04725 [Candidatus Methylomirabilia bacterium]
MIAIQHVAVGDQALSWLDHLTLRRYARGLAAQGGIGSFMKEGSHEARR